VITLSSKFGLQTKYIHNNSVKPDENLKLLLNSKRSTEPSPEGITSFMTFRYPVGTHTMFKNIYRVPFGYEFENGSYKKTWSPKFSTQNCDIKSAIERIEELLFGKIEGMTKNKEIGIVLSGGLDSSLIVALTRKLYPMRKIRTYTVGFVGDNEFEYAKVIADLFKTDHKEIELGIDDYLGEKSIIKELIVHKCEPLHPNELALAYAEKEALEDGCEVILCGEGADDIFGGYGRNLRMYLNFNGSSIKDFLEFFLDNYRYFTLEERKQFIKPEYLVDDLKLSLAELTLEDFPARLEDAALYITQRLHTPGLITRGINAITYNGLEACFPFIDDKLVEFVNSLHFEYKVRWKNEESRIKAKGLNFRKISENYDIPKYILKKTAEKYLPEEIIYRKKYGFPVPFESWMKSINSWNFHKKVFATNDISSLSGWKKFMLINLDLFVKEFF
jgi:asparagine synthetase B (glutamine-hydrolysing)